MVAVSFQQGLQLSDHIFLQVHPVLVVHPVSIMVLGILKEECFPRKEWERMIIPCNITRI